MAKEHIHTREYNQESIVVDIDQYTISMNVIPSSGFQSTVSTDQDKLHQSNAVSSLPDTFRQQEGGAVPLSSQLNDRHPLMMRVQSWEQTQRERQLEQYRQVFGIAEPMKRVMELEIVQNTDFNPLNSSNIHQDILLNKDTSIDWEDVYTENNNTSGMMVANDIHTTIENKLNL